MFKCEYEEERREIAIRTTHGTLSLSFDEVRDILAMNDGSKWEAGRFTVWYDGYTYYAILPDAERRIEFDQADLHSVLPEEYYR